MFDVKDKRILPSQILLFGALGLYLWKLNRVATLGTKFSVDTDKLSRAAMPWVPVSSHMAPVIQDGLKKGLDIVLEKIRK